MAANGNSSIIDPLAPEQSYTMSNGGQKDTSHRMTIEDVVDEEDILHPPPSGHPADNAAKNNGTTQASAGSLSEKMAGKQRASEEPPEDAAAAPKPPPKLDVSSEEAFPSLGASKPTAPAAATGGTWGAKPAIRSMNGVNGKAPASGVSSRSSTPASGLHTPASTVSGRGVNLPGRFEDWISFQPSELTPANALKTSRAEVLRDINRRSKAKVEMKQGADNSVKFVGTGPRDAVNQALREVASKLTAKVFRLVILCNQSTNEFLHSNRSKSRFLHLSELISLAAAALQSRIS